MYAIYGNMDPINIPSILALIYQHQPDPIMGNPKRHRNTEVPSALRVSVEMPSRSLQLRPLELGGRFLTTMTGTGGDWNHGMDYDFPYISI